MTKLDWSKGYTPDPARVLREEEALPPDPRQGKTTRKTTSNTWHDAMKALRRKELEVEGIALSQDEVVSAFRHIFGLMRPKRTKLIKHLVGRGLLLQDGTPNFNHPDIIDLLVSKRRRRK